MRRVAVVGYVAAILGLVVICLRAAGTTYAPYLGAAVVLAAVVLLRKVDA